MGDRWRAAPGGTARDSFEASTRLLVHVHITKTGGSTLNHILRSSYGTRHCPVEPWDSKSAHIPFTVDDLRKVRRLYPNLRSIAGHRVFGYVDLSDGDSEADYFALIRDPVRACASRFQHKVETTGNWNFDEFEEWLSQDWIRNRHTKALVGSDDVDAAMRLISEKNIFVGLTERYDESMLLLKSRLAPDLNISYRPVNVASKRSVSKRLLSDERRRALIEEAQASDIELLRRVRDELWPEYLQEYGASFETDLEDYRNSRGDFNDLNIFMSRLKAHAVYKPALHLHRRRARSRPPIN